MMQRKQEIGARSSRGAHAVTGMLLLLMPVVSLQGPGNTTLMDVAGIVFLTVYWCHILARRLPIALPLLLPFWLIGIGSFIGLFAAHDVHRALLQMVKEVYLYALFVGVTDFITRYCRAKTVAAIWVWIASAIGILMAIDYHTRAFGGFFSAEARAAGTFANPNMGGNYLVMSFFLAWGLVQAGQRRFLLAMPACVAGALATASNGAALSLAVGSVAAAALYSSRRLTQFIGMGCVVAGLTIAFLGGGREWLERSVLDRVSQGKRDAIGGTAMEGASERFPLWLDAAYTFQETPSGVGAGNFNRLGGPVSGDFHGAHNTYIGMLVERGPIGLLGWLLVLVTLVRRVIELRTRAALATPLLGVEPLCGILAATAVHSITMELFHFRHVWMFMALVWAILAQSPVPLAARFAKAAPGLHGAIAERA
jgi:O-antigen ligase